MLFFACVYTSLLCVYEKRRLHLHVNHIRESNRKKTDDDEEQMTIMEGNNSSDNNNKQRITLYILYDRSIKKYYMHMVGCDDSCVCLFEFYK